MNICVEPVSGCVRSGELENQDEALNVPLPARSLGVGVLGEPLLPVGVLWGSRRHCSSATVKNLTFFLAP